MKKFFVVVLSMISVCVCAIALTACGEKKHTHSYSVRIITPTCTEQGYTLHSCECGDNYKDTYENALGHDEISHSGQAATCSKKGWQDYITCSRCDYTTYQEIDHLPHHIVIDAAVSASCTQTGLTEGSHCSECGKTIIKQTIMDKTLHKESEWIIDENATCSKEGNKHTVCAICGETIITQTIDKIAHSYGNWAVKTPSSCSELGVERRECTKCHEYETRPIAMLPHTEVIDKAVHATCTSTGLTQGSHCSVCEKEIVKQVATNKIAHDYGDWKLTKPATCIEVGLKQRKCKSCNASETQTTPLAPHTEVIDKAVPATCTSTGLTQGSHCSVCGKEIVKQVTTNKIAHDYGDWKLTKPATCIEVGLEQRKCKNCNASETQSTPLAPHTEVIDEAVSATCSTMGLTEGRHCAVCNTVLLEQYEVAKIAHTWVTDPRVEPTCVETGLTSGRHCSVCGEVSRAQTIIEAYGHLEFTDFKIFPTCTETGLTEGSHCWRCGLVLVKQEEIPATGHYVQVDSSVAPTCTQTGLTEGKHCYICNYVIIEQEVIPAFGHKETIREAINPTCVNVGWTEGLYCANCFMWFNEPQKVEPLGHSESILPTIAPTCTESGLTEGKSCSRCNHIFVEQELIPALGHDWSCKSVDNLKHTIQCIICNYIVENELHDWNDNCCTLCAFDAGGTKNLNYALSNEKEYYILNGIGESNESDIVIPETYNGLPVSKIKNGAFFHCNTINTIELPNTITTIPVNAFSASSLCFIELPNSILAIESSAFSFCSLLKNIVLSNNITSIESYAFSFCDNLTNIIIPDSVTSIGTNIFQNSGVVNVTLPKGITTVSYSMFMNCKKLSQINIPQSVTRIESYAFSNSGIIEITIPKNIQYIGSRAFQDSKLSRAIFETTIEWYFANQILIPYSTLTDPIKAATYLKTEINDVNACLVCRKKLIFTIEEICHEN